MQIQKLSNQNFGVTVFSDKITDTMRRERIRIGDFWGFDSPQYNYCCKTQQQIDDLHQGGVLDLYEDGNYFSLLLLRKNDLEVITKTYKNVKLSSKLIVDFLKNIKELPKQN